MYFKIFMLSKKRSEFVKYFLHVKYMHNFFSHYKYISEKRWHFFPLWQNKLLQCNVLCVCSGGVINCCRSTTERGGGINTSHYGGIYFCHHLLDNYVDLFVEIFMSSCRISMLHCQIFMLTCHLFIC